MMRHDDGAAWHMPSIPYSYKTIDKKRGEMFRPERNPTFFFERINAFRGKKRIFKKKGLVIAPITPIIRMRLKKIENVIFPVICI